MAVRESPHVGEFRAALEAWTDERFISRRQLFDLAMFNLYLVNLAEADGWEYDGHSLKVAIPMSCLIVRATMDGVAYVVFTSARTTTSCIHIFLRKLEEGLLEWRVDQFR